MPKSPHILKSESEPNWLSKIVTLAVGAFIFSFLIIAATGLWKWLGTAIIIFIVILISLYGIHFIAETTSRS